MNETNYNQLKAWVEAGTTQMPRFAHIVIEGSSAEGEPATESVHIYDPMVETGITIPIAEFEANGIDQTQWDNTVSETKARAQATIDRIETYSNSV